MSILWLVKPVGFQSIVKRCPYCKIKSAFFPSGKFRVNAQKKVLDVWNIYKCVRCDYTWNIEIISRAKLESIKPTHYAGFQNNDPSLVKQYAFDYGNLLKNRAEVGAAPEFLVEVNQSTCLPVNNILKVTIILEYPIPIKLISVLTKKLLLSRSKINAMIENDLIQGITLDDLKRKINGPTVLYINIDKVEE